MEEQAPGSRDEGRRVSRLIGGALLVLVGGLLVLQNFGVVRAGSFGDYWPLLLVWVGATRLLGPNRAGHAVSGMVILALGVYFQAERLGWLSDRVELWPLFLVAVGAALIFEGMRAKRSARLTVSPGAERGSRS